MSELLPLGKSERYGACDGVTTLWSYDSCANSGLQYPPRRGRVANAASVKATKAESAAPEYCPPYVVQQVT